MIIDNLTAFKELKKYKELTEYECINIYGQFLIPMHMALLHRVAPYLIGDDALILAAEEHPSEILLQDLALVSGLPIFYIKQPHSVVQACIDRHYDMAAKENGDCLCGGQPEAYGLPADWEHQVDCMIDQALHEAFREGWPKLRFQECGNEANVLRGDDADQWTLVRTLPWDSAPWLEIRLDRWIVNCVFSGLHKKGLTDEGLEFVVHKNYGTWIHFEDHIDGIPAQVGVLVENPTGEIQGERIYTFKITALE